MAATSHMGRDPKVPPRKQAPILASDAEIDRGVAKRMTGGVPRAIAAAATIVEERGRREGRDLPAALMHRCKLPHPEGLIFETSHLSLRSFMSQRDHVAAPSAGSAQWCRFEATRGIHGVAAKSRGGRDTNALHRKQSPSLAEVVQTDHSIAARRSRKLPREAAAEATIVWDHDSRPAAHA